MSDQIHRIVVTAKTSYDGVKTPVEVNSGKPLKLETKDYDVYVTVRVKDYANDTVNTTDHQEALKYFEDPRHQSDSFSVQFVVKFKRDVDGSLLLWGNDWDHPIRDMLPWGFSAAFAAFKYAVDPGITSDVYSDKPWIYGPVLSSVNYMQKLTSDEDPEKVENVTETEPEARYKKYWVKENLDTFTFKAGETYAFDFANPYLDMSTTPKIKMPGFTFDVGKYAGLTELRYVLKCGEDLVFALVFEAEA